MIALLGHSKEKVSRALMGWRERKPLPTGMSSYELRELAREARERAVFSARCTSAEFLSEVQRVVDDMLAGKINMADGRLRLMRKLKELGYDPEKGFPQLEAGHRVPPAEKGSLQDLSSRRRLDLILETNTRMAANRARVAAGNTPYLLHAYPAWELIRQFTRVVPRGGPRSESPGWYERWAKAGASVGWVGAIDGPMMALKDSPIWKALGDGVGGYDDVLDNPYPPFAFGSGMGWRDVPRKEAMAEGLLKDFGMRSADFGIGEKTESGPMTGATLTPGQREVKSVLERLTPEMREALRKELAA